MGSLKIRPPEDIVTQMARRAFGRFRAEEMKVGARIREWDDLVLKSQIVWKDIVGSALGERGTLICVNPGLRDPHTVVITGLSEDRAQAIRSGIEAKLGGTTEKLAMQYSDKAWESPTPAEVAAASDFEGEIEHTADSDTAAEFAEERRAKFLERGDD